MVERNSNRPLGEDYILQQPMNIYGMFFPIGTEYWKINADWWYPFYNDALMPAYAVHFTVIRNNPQYFAKLIPCPICKQHKQCSICKELNELK